MANTKTRTNYITVTTPPSNLLCSSATALHIAGCPTGSLTIDFSNYPTATGDGNTTGWNYNTSTQTVTYGPFVVPTGMTSMRILCDDSSSAFGFTATTPGSTISLTRTGIGGVTPGEGFSAQVQGPSGLPPSEFGFPGNWNDKFVFGTGGPGAGSDAMFEIYGDGVFHTSWYRFTNNTGAPAYFRTEVTCLSVPGLAAFPRVGVCLGEFTGTCGDPKNPFIRPELDNIIVDHLFVSDAFNELDTNKLCADMRAGDSFDSIYGERVGLWLEAGQTIYLELGAYNPNISGSQPIGVIRLDWTLLTYSSYDVMDRRQPVSAGPGFIGQSDVMPPSTALDLSGFSPLIGSGGGILNPNGYIHFNGHHFITVSSTDPNQPYGGCGNDSDTTELAVFELDENGNQVAFNIIYTFVGSVGSIIIFNDGGEYPFGQGFSTADKFCTDGENLWLVVAARPLQINQYDLITPHQLWDPATAMVFHYNGTSFNLIAVIPTYTSNAQNAAAAFGPNNGSLQVMDACASPAEPGIVRILVSEAGTLDQPPAMLPCPNIFQGPSRGQTCGGHRCWGRATWHAVCNTTTLVSQTLLRYDERPIYSGGPFVQLGTQESYTGIGWIRNDDGHPIWAWGVPLTGETASPGYQFKIEFRDLLTDTLLSTVDHTQVDQVLTSPLATTLLKAQLSRNAEVDPFDGRRCYLLTMNTNPTARNASFRIDVNDSFSAHSIDDDPTNSFNAHVVETIGFGNSSSNYWYPEAKSIWVPRAQLSGALDQFVRCDDIGWQRPNLGYGFAVSEIPQYPDMRFTTEAMLLDDGSFYAGGQWGNVINQFGLFRSHILHDWYICQLGPETICLTDGLHVWVKL